MASLASPLTTYSDTTPHRRVITDIVSLIDPSDAPLIDALGGLDGASSKFRFVNGNGKVVEWLEDTLPAITDTLAEGASIANTIVSIAVTDPTLYEPGHVILIGTELCWVSAVGAVSITVTRGVAGTTAAASQASVAPVTFVGLARLEGDDSDAISFSDRTVGSNVTQIFHQEVKVSRSQRQLSQYGIADELSYQTDRVVPSLMRLIERTLFYNKALAAGSATTPRIMAGIPAFITTNLVSGATLAQTQFDSAVRLAYTAGGTGPWVAVVSPANLNKIKAFYDSSTVLRIDRSETTVGMQITQIMTPFGMVNLLLDRWCPDALVPILDMKHCGMKTFSPFTQEDLAKTGDADKVEVVGEFTFCLRQQKASAMLTACS
jgi:hypothetical protein